MTELYEQLLGPAWWALDEPVRRVHAAGMEARGCFRVAHGEGWLARRVARWSRLPPPAVAAAVQLQIVEEGSQQRWERNFDGHVFITRQWAAPDRQLVERVQSWELHFGLQVADGTLRYVQRGARFCLGKLQLPFVSALAPRVSALECADGPDRVRVTVTVTLPFLGLLIAYEGFLEVKGATNSLSPQRGEGWGEG